MLATPVQVVLLMLFVLTMCLIVGGGFVVVLIASIYFGRFRWRGVPSPIQRAKNPIAFWLSLAPFVFFVGVITYVAGNIIVELCRGTAK